MKKYCVLQKKQLLQGFTLVEMIVVLVIVAILAAMGTARFSTQTYDTSQFNNKVYSGLRFMQRMAVSTRCYTQVTYTVATQTFSFKDKDTFCTGAYGDAKDPSGKSPFTLVAPTQASVTITPAGILSGGVYTFHFDGLGRVVDGIGDLLSADVTITISDSSFSKIITIKKNFGYMSNSNA